MKKETKQTKFKPGEIRVINIDRAATIEWFFESIQEHCHELFNLGNMSEYELQCVWNKDTEELTCIIKDGEDRKNTVKEFDFVQIRTKVGVTTKSLFEKPCYITLNYLEDPTLIK